MAASMPGSGENSDPGRIRDGAEQSIQAELRQDAIRFRKN
jgi:hypothetical protein